MLVHHRKQQKLYSVISEKYGGLRYLGNNGEVIERFFGVVDVHDITSLSLKNAIDNFFAKHGL